MNLFLNSFHNLKTHIQIYKSWWTKVHDFGYFILLSFFQSKWESSFCVFGFGITKPSMSWWHFLSEWIKRYFLLFCPFYHQRTKKDSTKISFVLSHTIFIWVWKSWVCLWQFTNCILKLLFSMYSTYFNHEYFRYFSDVIIHNTLRFQSP